MAIHYIWPAPVEQDDKNKAVLSALNKIREGGGIIKVIQEGPILDGKVILPFLETSRGRRYFGVNSINNYAENYQSS